MKARLAGMFALALACGCSEQEVIAELRSLQGSEDAVFVCRDGNGQGRPYSDCPDRDDTDEDADPSKDLSIIALVSQTVTEEIALVDITAGRVLDADPSTPGFGFLRVGGRPVALATTPGGVASFVATADVGRNGVFGLPTSCLGAPEVGKPARDLTTWPACRLPSTPGELAVVVGAASDTPCDPLTPVGELNGECSADLSAEGGAAGRRKLIVSLPDEGQLVVLDAQELLNRKPGTFDDCVIEDTLALTAEVPAGVVQTLPADLQTTCAEAPPPVAPPPSRRAPQPAGFATSDERLYVADQAAPVIHVVDTSNACDLTELSPLLPLSLREPERVVTTRKVAASPLTPSGKRYVYAIDAEDQPGASVMAFDVSPDSTDPTPLVRSGSPELPGEKPDRLALGASARDITFAYRDLPYSDGTGVAEFGALCDPNPAVSSEVPAGLARPNRDLTTGARPGLLRGLFGFVLLTNGTIGIVDVEDFDAPCRRPRRGNVDSTPDFRGCAGDVVSDFTLEGESTVTNEVSCRVVEPHRFRSARVAVNDPDIGIRAPSLRGFPQLTLPPDVADSTVEDRPRLLAVPFSSDPSDVTDVYVGSTRYSNEPDVTDALPVNPNSRESEVLETQNSVVLPPLQPRAYASEDTALLTYEGSYAGDRTAGFFNPGDDTFRDSSLSFCAAGVYDVAAMTDYAVNVLGLTADQAAPFASEHADYVQITSELPAEDDSYWSAPGRDRARCDVFGAHDAESLAKTRDFRIVSAFGGTLRLESRTGEAPVALAAECFPTANKYRLRGGNHWILTHSASGFRHDIVESGADRACVRSCNPLKKWSKGRAFEIASRDNCRGETLPDDGMEPLELRVGCAREDEVACVYDQGPPQSPTGGVTLGGEGSECVFEGLTERFAVYRGRKASDRDAVFSWQTSGGFVPLVMSLTEVSSVVSPQSIQFLSQPERVAVVDGSSLGLSLFSLDTFEVTKPSPFY